VNRADYIIYKPVLLVDLAYLLNSDMPNLHRSKNVTDSRGQLEVDWEAGSNYMSRLQRGNYWIQGQRLYSE
jgi:hypothetical protein